MLSDISFDPSPLKNLVTNRRLLVLVGVTTGFLGMLAFTSESFSYAIEQIFWVDMRRTSLILLLVSFFSISLLYLQSGGNQKPEEGSKETQGIAYEIQLSKDRLSDLDAQLRAISNKLDIASSGTSLSEEEKTRVVEAIVAQVGEASIESIFHGKANALSEEIRKKLNFERLSFLSRGIVERLRREIADLRLRSNINLVIGMSITAGGLYLLWTTVSIVDASEMLRQLASEGNDANSRFIKNLTLPLIPRVLLVIFVEIFAYFFLRLYRDGLAEIKYFQNELTNVESKLFAVEVSCLVQNLESMKSSLEALSRTERNFILEKGQTTVELECAKAESELTRNVLKSLPSLFRRSSK